MNPNQRLLISAPGLCRESLNPMRAKSERLAATLVPDPTSGSRRQIAFRAQLSRGDTEPEDPHLGLVRIRCPWKSPC